VSGLVLVKKLNEARNALGAWEDAFGTTQLSHAIAHHERLKSILTEALAAMRAGYGLAPESFQRVFDKAKELGIE